MGLLVFRTASLAYYSAYVNRAKMLINESSGHKNHGSASIPLWRQLERLIHEGSVQLDSIESCQLGATQASDN